MTIAQSQRFKLISINFNREKGPLNTSFKECLGAESAHEHFGTGWQQQLAVARNECGFKYLRMNGLSRYDITANYKDSKGKPAYNYQNIDDLYDYIVSIGMKPFIELDFIPSAPVGGRKTIFWWKRGVNSLKDYGKWLNLVQNLVRHFTERYGRDEVKTWYFEICNQPNLTDGFPNSSQADYFKLYRYSAMAIKSVDKGYKVGGLAKDGADWVPAMITFCSKRSIPIDFISTTACGNPPGVEEYGSTGAVPDTNPASISGHINIWRKQIQASAMPGLELHYKKCSISSIPVDPIHDNYSEAALLLNKIKQTAGVANSLSYCTFTDIFEEVDPRLTLFHGDVGLLNREIIKKPASYAYMFLNKLGPTELLNGDGSTWACKNNKGDLQVLLWDYTYIIPSSVYNEPCYARDLPAKSKGLVRISLSGIPEGKYRLEISKVDNESNDVHGTRLSFDKSIQLASNQVKSLNEQPKEKQNITIDRYGKFSIEISLLENDVYLFNLIKEGIKRHQTDDSSA